MITASTTRTTLRRSARLGLAGAALLAAATGASADDGGLGGFLASIFGGGSQQQAAPAPQAAPGYAPAYTRYRRVRSRPQPGRRPPAHPSRVARPLNRAKCRSTRTARCAAATP